MKKDVQECVHGDPCCELCRISGDNWDEPTAVTRMLDEMRASLAEAKEAAHEQRDAAIDLRKETKKRTGRQLRRTLTPPDFPVVAGDSKG